MQTLEDKTICVKFLDGTCKKECNGKYEECIYYVPVERTQEPFRKGKLNYRLQILNGR